MRQTTFDKNTDNNIYHHTHANNEAETTPQPDQDKIISFESWLVNKLNADAERLNRGEVLIREAWARGEAVPEWEAHWMAIFNAYKYRYWPKYQAVVELNNRQRPNRHGA